MLIAWVASSSFSIVTKPKPRLRPVSRSLGIDCVRDRSVFGRHDRIREGVNIPRRAPSHNRRTLGVASPPWLTMTGYCALEIRQLSRSARHKLQEVECNLRAGPTRRKCETYLYLWLMANKVSMIKDRRGLERQREHDFPMDELVLCICYGRDRPCPICLTVRCAPAR